MRRFFCLLLCSLLAFYACAYSEGSAIETKLEAMLPALDSVVRATDGEGVPYDPENPESVWMVLYLMVVNWGDGAIESSADTDWMVVNKDTVEQFARAAFADLAQLPEIPPEFQGTARFDAERQCYLLAMSDAGDSFTKVDVFLEKPDGSVVVTVGMYGHGENDEEQLGQMAMCLIPDDEAAPDAEFFYRVQSLIEG